MVVGIFLNFFIWVGVGHGLPSPTLAPAICQEKNKKYFFMFVILLPHLYGLVW